ncbi:collagen-like protein [Myxococcota bacterium]
MQERCVQLCLTDKECVEEGSICNGDFCELGERTDLPVIVGIDGDGTEDLGPGHTEHRIRRSLTVRGSHLAGVSVFLSGPNHHGQELDVCVPGDTEITVELPDWVEEGAHLLSVSTQAGSCEATLPLLEGEQGVKGDPGAVGPPGVKGDTGAQGEQGVKGDPGAVGTPGVKGDTGAQGEQGVKGDPGSYVIGDGLNLDGTTLSVDSAPLVPSGAVMFFNLATCPSNWTEVTAARGRYLVGLNTGGNLAATVGTALADRANRSAGAHSHQYYRGTVNTGASGYSSFGDFGAGPWPHGETSTSTNSGGLASGTNAPYVQFLVCQKS